MCNYFEFGPILLFKFVFLILALSGEQKHLTQNYGDHLCETNFNLDQQFRKPHLKIFQFSLWQPFCSGPWNCLCKVGRGHYGEHTFP